MEVDWNPVLTFDRRRSAYLDWLEENCKLVGYRHGNDVFGIAAGSYYQRLELHRKGMKLDFLDPSADLNALESPLRGLGVTFEFNTPEIDFYSGRWTQTLEGSLEEVSRRLAEEGIPLRASATPTDIAVLADLVTEDAHIQVEYGVVDMEQLVERLMDPQVGKSLGPDDPIGNREMIDALPGECALLVDVLWRPEPRTLLSEPVDVLPQIAMIESRITSLVRELAANV